MKKAYEKYACIPAPVFIIPLKIPTPACDPCPHALNYHRVSPSFLNIVVHIYFLSLKHYIYLFIFFFKLIMWAEEYLSSKGGKLNDSVPMKRGGEKKNCYVRNNQWGKIYITDSLRCCLIWCPLDINKYQFQRFPLLIEECAGKKRGKKKQAVPVKMKLSFCVF